MAVYKWSRRSSRHFGEIWIPLAYVELRKADGAFQAVAMQFDSGAVVSLLRRSAADLLGLDYKAGRKVSLGSVGGSSTVAYVHDVTTRFDKATELAVPFAIVETESVPNLLGRLGVFDRFQVDFDPAPDKQP